MLIVIFHTKISLNRWFEAQNFEVNDWLYQPDIVKNELAEAKQKYQKIFTKLEKELNIISTSKILDVGCNLTCVSLLIREGQHYGIEPLADKLKIAEKVKGIKVVTGTGEKITFPDSYFDLIICRNVIDHTHNPLKVISEMDRVLLPHGHLYLACYVYHPFFAVIKKIGEMTYIFRNTGHPHIYSPKSLQHLIPIGYKVIKVSTIYTGKGPHDFGKTKNQLDTMPVLHKFLILISQKIFRHDWFVKEIAIFCQKL